MLVKYSPTQVERAAMFVKMHNHYQSHRSLDDITREIYGNIRNVAYSYANDEDYLTHLSTSGYHIQVMDVVVEFGKFIEIEIEVLVDPAVSVDLNDYVKKEYF